jgi:hypothetical protein
MTLTKGKGKSLEDAVKSVNEKVPGHSDATYGPVPKANQIFEVEFVDIAPTPIIA